MSYDFWPPATTTKICIFIDAPEKHVRHIKTVKNMRRATCSFCFIPIEWPTSRSGSWKIHYIHLAIHDLVVGCIEMNPNNGAVRDADRFWQTKYHKKKNQPHNDNECEMNAPPNAECSTKFQAGNALAKTEIRNTVGPSNDLRRQRNPNIISCTTIPMKNSTNTAIVMDKTRIFSQVQFLFQASAKRQLHISEKSRSATADFQLEGRRLFQISIADAKLFSIPCYHYSLFAVYFVCCANYSNLQAVILMTV